MRQAINQLIVSLLFTKMRKRGNKKLLMPIIKKPIQ